jgi:PAS domain S-box-containing protein
MQHPTTILIVDDQESARQVLTGLLISKGYELVFASNGEEALAKAVELTPDLILLDVMMPGMNGFEVCRWLRADSQLAEIPIIMLTALDDQDSRLEGIKAGADDFITKPFDRLELQARVQSITRLNRYRRLLTERVYRQQAEEEVHRRNDELTMLNRVITTAASTLNSRDILYLACEGLAQLFDLPRATAFLLNQEQNQFIDVVEYLAPILVLAMDPSERDLKAETLAGEPVPFTNLMLDTFSQNKLPLTLVDGQEGVQSAEFYRLMQERGSQAMLVVPIYIGDHLAGLVELESPEPRHFSNQDLTLAQSLAAAIGQALETAQLYQDLQNHADNLEMMIEHRTRELQYERDRTQAILEALGEAVVVTDTTGVIQYMNPAATTLTGFNTEEVLGRNWRLWQGWNNQELDQEDEAEAVLYDEILEVVRSGQTWHGEMSKKRKDGLPYEALLTVAPLVDLDQPEQITGIVSVQSDITALKEAERVRALNQEHEKQAALDRLRHTFLSTVNHEMRTPIALISQTIEMLESFQLGYLTPEQLDAIMAMRRQSKTLGQMIEGLTKVAGFLSKQETVRPVLAQLEPVFNTVLPLAEFKARNKEIIVETEIAPQLPFFPLDVKQMEEALTQLIDNAIKFNQRGGKIKISAQADNHWVTIAVSDTGKGIEAEALHRIWDLFEQGTDPVRRAQEGLGLGLVLVRYIVEAHRGIVEVKTVLGQGSTFTIKLPRKKPVTRRFQ